MGIFEWLFFRASNMPGWEFLEPFMDYERQVWSEAR